MFLLFNQNKNLTNISLETIVAIGCISYKLEERKKQNYFSSFLLQNYCFWHMRLRSKIAL